MESVSSDGSTVTVVLTDAELAAVLVSLTSYRDTNLKERESLNLSAELEPYPKTATIVGLIHRLDEKFMALILAQAHSMRSGE